MKRILFLILVFSFLIACCKLKKQHCNGAIVLIGGGSCIEAIKWMLQRTTNNSILVIGYDEEEISWIDEIRQIGKVEYLNIPTKEAANSQEIISKIIQAESILISGGEQNNYVDLWKGTKLANELSKISKRIPIAGVSAGLAIMGEYYYSGQNGTVISYDALLNPYNHYMSCIDSKFLTLPFMENIITDSHYSERDRMGRHIAFMARILNDRYTDCIKGIGLDEGTAVCIDMMGMAVVVGSGNCYLVESLGIPEICSAEHCLIWEKALKVKEIISGTYFNFRNWPMKNSLIWSVDKGRLVKSAV